MIKFEHSLIYGFFTIESNVYTTCTCYNSLTAKQIRMNEIIQSLTYTRIKNIKFHQYLSKALYDIESNVYTTCTAYILVSNQLISSRFTSLLVIRQTKRFTLQMSFINYMNSTRLEMMVHSNTRTVFICLVSQCLLLTVSGSIG